MLRKTVFLICFLTTAFMGAWAQEDGTTLGDYIQGEKGGGSSSNSNVHFGLGGVFGATNINGENYQQIGFRPEVKIWKFGMGLDFQILLNEEGKIRKEDWDDWKDYMDKIYYISYGKKGEPLYIRYGGLDSTVLGYGILINGYTNMVEYPTYKRQGLEFAFQTGSMGGEFMVNDLKELTEKTPSCMGGGRIYLRPVSKIQVGVSLAGDIDEYEGLRDTDGDGYPDEIDAYPDDDKYVTEREYYEGKGLAPTTIADMINHGVISGITRNDITKYGDKKSKTGFWSGDVGFKVLEKGYVTMDLYSQFAQCINTGGWGMTLPGIKLGIGEMVTLYGEYKQSSDEFIFGYYNDTYDLERANFEKNGLGDLIVHTKKEQLKAAKAGKGFYSGIKLNLFEFVTANLSYQYLRDKDKVKDKSIRGELELNADVIPKISKAKAFYVQNNVNKFEWKTESSMLGGVLGLGLGTGVSLDFQYLVTFEDKNGDGEIKGSDETIKNISVSTSAVF